MTKIPAWKVLLEAAQTSAIAQLFKEGCTDEEIAELIGLGGSLDVQAIREKHSMTLRVIEPSERRAIELQLARAQPSATLTNIFAIMQAKMIAHWRNQDLCDARISAILSITPEKVTETRRVMAIP